MRPLFFSSSYLKVAHSLFSERIILGEINKILHAKLDQNASVLFV